MVALLSGCDAQRSILTIIKGQLLYSSIKYCRSRYDRTIWLLLNSILKLRESNSWLLEGAFEVHVDAACVYIPTLVWLGAITQGAADSKRLYILLKRNPVYSCSSAYEVLKIFN